MNSNSTKWRLEAGLSLTALCAAFYLLFTAATTAADPKPQPDAKAKKAEAGEKTTEKKPEKAKLSGADLYAMHCNRCHPERYATERTANQWKTLMLHMRVRANLPADQAKTILKYLQEDSGK